MPPDRHDAPLTRRALLAGAGALAAGAPTDVPADEPRAAPAGRPAALPATTRPTFAVSLGSGAVHGLAHIGVIRALEREGVLPDLIVGCSAGAAIGALWAAGLDAAAIERAARTIDWSNVGTWTLPWRGLMHGDGLQRAIRQAVGARAIEQLPMRFAAVATELESGDSIALDRGPVDLAVAASCAVPVLFVPVRIGGRNLVDGSLSAPVPVDAARERGADVVLAVDVAYRPGDAVPQLVTDIAFQAVHILVNALSAQMLRRADVALKLDLHRLMLRGPASVAALAGAGEQAMRDAWPQLAARLGR